ncbi:hypothetical protein HaLaN_16490, partial [Haematococcus lacustris]
MLAVQAISPHRITTDEAAAPAIWWERLRAADADEVEKAKELCTCGDLTRLANKSLDAFITLLDTGGPLLPPPGKPQCWVLWLQAEQGDVAASLLSGVCKCVHGAHVNNTKLEKLRDRCLDLLDLVLDLGGIGAFISTCRSSSELPKLSKEFTSIMDRFVACIKEVKAYGEHYTKAGREGGIAGYNMFLLYHKHKEGYDELDTKLRDLTAHATLTLGVYHKMKMLEDVLAKLNTGMPPV